MAPRKKSANPPAAAVNASPRKTRSATAGKRVVRPPVAKPPPKKARLAKEKGDGKEPSLADSSSVKSVVIEACKQCNSFKTRANMVKEGLESAVAGISVTINSDKPRRGCFEIRDESGKVFISLLDMKRPFKPMKDLDMDKVIEDIVQKIN